MFTVFATARLLQLRTVACSDVPFMKNTVQPVLSGVYRHFQNSSVREAGLRSMQDVIGEPTLKLVEPSFVRWLSHDAAVHAFLVSLPAVILELERKRNSVNVNRM